MTWMDFLHYTEVFILVATVIILIWDAYVYITKGNAATESATMFRWSVHVPPLVFISGIICGHFFFQMHEPSEFAIDDVGHVIWQVGPQTLQPGQILTVDKNGLFIPK